MSSSSSLLAASLSSSLRSSLIHRPFCMWVYPPSTGLLSAACPVQQKLKQTPWLHIREPLTSFPCFSLAAAKGKCRNERHQRERERERGGPFETSESEQPNTSFALLHISPPTPTVSEPLCIPSLFLPIYNAPFRFALYWPPLLRAAFNKLWGLFSS